MLSHNCCKVAEKMVVFVRHTADKAVCGLKLIYKWCLIFLANYNNWPVFIDRYVIRGILFLIYKRLISVSYST